MNKEAQDVPGFLFFDHVAVAVKHGELEAHVGACKTHAERSRAEYARALRLFPPGPDGWPPPVLTCSSLYSQGISDVWEMVQLHRTRQTETGWFGQRRSVRRSTG
jgi:putative protein kinase ArgK-like GTPase of G3E family